MVRSPRQSHRCAPAFARALLVAVGMAAAAAPWQPAAAAPPLEQLQRSDAAGLVAYVTLEGAPALVDPSSGARVQLDLVPQRAQFPAWSPDGSTVSVIATRSDGPGLDLYRLDRPGSQRAYVDAAAPPIYHGWSPGGTRLALLTSDAGSLALRLIDIDAGGAAGDARRFAEGAPFFWDWSPDGDALLVHRNVMSAEAEVGITGLDAYVLDPSFAAPGAFQSPAFSPSGAWVSYATRDGGDTRRVVLERLVSDDAAERRRELPHTGFTAFAWHPERDVLAVQRAVAGGPHAYGPIVTIDAERGDLEPLVDDLALAFWWSPDGARVAYLAPVPAARPEREQQVMARVQSPNGRMALRVVEVASGDLRELARFTPSPLFVTQYLPFFDQYARSHRLWSPASDALVLPVVDPTGGRVLRVYGLDGSARTLAPGDMPAWNVR